MPRKPDLSLIGQVYNNLRVDLLTDKYNAYNRRLYACTCLICGEKRFATKQNLQRGEIKDCGNHHDYNDITGKKFGRLTVLHVTDKKSKGKNRCKIWHCICDCGNEVDVLYNGLINKKIKSCGCLRKDNVRKLYKDGTAPSKLFEEKRKTNTSGVTGVYYDKSRDMWHAEITFKNKKHFLGRYTNKEDAIHARKKAEGEIFGGYLKNNSIPNKNST